MTTLRPWARVAARCGSYLLLGTWLACAASGYDFLLPPMDGSPGDFAPRRAGAEANASVKISVTNEALYRIRQPELTSARLPSASLVGAQLRLFCRTQEVAIFVSNSGLWTTNDYLVFYGQGFDGYHTNANVYWLGVGGSGRRMTVSGAAPFPGVSDVTSCTWQVQYRRNRWFRELYRPNDDTFDHWFAEALTDAAATNIPIATDQVVSSQAASVTVNLYGYTSLGAVSPDHCTRVTINGGVNTSFYYDGQSTFAGTWTFGGSALKAVNSVSFRQIPQTGVPADWAYLKDFSIAYVRNLASTGPSIIFPGRAGTNNYKVSGLAETNNLRILNVREPANPVLLSGFQPTSAAGKLTVRFGDADSATGRYVVCQSAGLRTVAGIERVAFRNLSDTNRQADYIVICPYAFRQPVYRLLERRNLQGLTVAVAPLPDIYNEFGYGIADAAAIKQFIGYTFHHWKGPPPRYVLLAGNGSYDPKGNLRGTSATDSYAAPDIIPVRMGPSVFKWTALDGWYAQVNGSDNVVDLALGRIPVTNATSFGHIVDKIVAFESVSPGDGRRTKALLAADLKDGSMDFRADCETIRTSFLSPAGFACTTAYRDYLSASQVRQAITGAINGGGLLSFYFGHGAFDQWGSDDIYNTNDVYGLSNTFHPVVSMLTCESGSFQSPTDKKSMTEAFLERQNRGASACLAATALTQQSNSRQFAQGFSREVATEKTKRLGDAFLGGCEALYNYNPTAQELLFMEIFGDPATIVNP